MQTLMELRSYEGPSKNVLTQQGRHGQSYQSWKVLCAEKQTTSDGSYGKLICSLFNIMCLKSLQGVKSYGTYMVIELSLLSLGQ